MIKQTPKETPAPTPRTLVGETNLAAGVVLLLPADAEKLLSHRFFADLDAASGEITRIENRRFVKSNHLITDQPVVAIGNLADSDAVRELYFDFNCATDLWYPGPGGLEVRTLVDPYGTGKNIIHVGYSDAEGRDAALDAIATVVSPVLPYQNQVVATRLPIAPHEVDRISKSQRPSLLWQYGQSDALNKGYVGYLNGDSALLEEFNATLAGIIEYGIPPGDHHIKDLHLRMHHILNLYRLLETNRLIDDAIREPFLSYLLEWAVSEEHGTSKIEEWRYSEPDFPRQNHGLLPALAFTYLADYFDRYHPGFSESKVWREKAKRVYEVYDEGSWKPLCDGLCHGWYLSQPAMLEYGLIDPDRSYFESGGARRAAEAAMAVVNNRGWMPAAGDHNAFRIYPGTTLRTAAGYYRDRRFWFVHQIAPQYRSMKYHSFLPRAFDVGLDAGEPIDDFGLRVVPMDPLVYNAAIKHADTIDAETFTIPNSAIEDCFDKLSVRTGWRNEDDFLLVDGLGGGSHAFEDAMGILDYERRGLSLIVQEDGSTWSSPEDHSLLTIVRDGEIGKIPSFATLVEATEETDRFHMIIELTGYAGTDWTREIWLFPDKYLVVHDSVVARVSGDYAIEAHYRIPGIATHNGAELKAQRRSFEGEEVRFVLSGQVSAPSHQSVGVLPHPRYQPNPGEGIPEYPEEDRVEAWRRRYNLDDPIVSHYRTRCAISLDKGDAVTFTHVAQGIWPGEEQASFSVDSGTIEIRSGNSRRLAPRIFASPRVTSIRTSKSSALLTPQPEILIEAEDTITDFVLSGDNLVWGTQAGDVGRYLFSTGESIHTALDAPVHAIGIVNRAGVKDTSNDRNSGGERLLCVGYGENRVACLDDSLSALWQHSIEREPTSCPWWELRNPSAVSVLGIPSGQMAKDAAIFAVGCGDLLVRAFDLNGRVVWRFHYENGVPARLTAIDGEGDGSLNIMVGGEIQSNQSTARFLNWMGVLIREIPVEGWTSLMTSTDWIRSEGGIIAAFGSTRGKTLRVYRIDHHQGTEPRELFSALLGGRVNGLQIVETQSSQRDDPTIVAATSQGFLNAYSSSGDKLWSRMYMSGLSHLQKIGMRVLAIEETGSAHLVDVSGKEISTFALGVEVKTLRPGDDSVLFSDGRFLKRLGTDFID